MELYIFGAIVVLILIFLFFTLYPFKTAVTTVQKQGPYTINNKDIKLYDDEKRFIKNPSASFQGFFYLENKQKPKIYTPCSTTDPSKVNCDTGRYSLCSCDGADCSVCEHKGYFPLINLNGIVILELMNVPDASRQGKAHVQLKIRTQSSGKISDNSGNTYNPDITPVNTGITQDTIDSNDDITSNPSGKYQYIETFVLPNLPYNKWIMITINREGRRFDIYYNSKLILSKYTSTNLYNDTVVNKSIKIGDINLDGQAGYFTLYPTVLSGSEISILYSSLVNTRGTPLIEGAPGINFQVAVPSLCPSGDCLVKPTNPPSMPFYEWSTQYA